MNVIVKFLLEDLDVNSYAYMIGHDTEGQRKKKVKGEFQDPQALLNVQDIEDQDAPIPDGLPKVVEDSNKESSENTTKTN